MTREEVIEGLERFLGNHQIYDDDAIENAINFLDNEQTPDDMLNALAVVGDMDVSDQKRYFNIEMNLTGCFDALYLLAKGGTPETIFKTVEKYKDDKYYSKMKEQEQKVRQLIEEIGLRNLKHLTEQFEKEVNEGKCRTNP